MTRYHDKLRDYGAKALDRALEGITVPTVVHLCYGYPGLGRPPQHEYEYTGVLPELMKTKISGFTVEFGRSQFDPEVLKAVRRPDRDVRLHRSRRQPRARPWTP